MKHYLTVTIVILAMFSMAYAQDPTLDDLLSKHYKAMGIEKLQMVNTIIMTGSIVQQDAMPVKIIRMRPDKYLMEFDIQDITTYQAFDGQTAWWTTPWTGNPKPQVMPDERAKDMKSKADFDGLLFNWKEKGHTLELLGSDTVGESLAYKLKIIKKDGGVEYYFMDVKESIILKRMYYRTVRGQEIAIEIFYSDYRPVQGVLFPYKQDTHYGGQPYNSLQFDAIELNKPIDVQSFRMPVK
jgi:hypothetical protein